MLKRLIGALVARAPEQPRAEAVDPCAQAVAAARALLADNRMVEALAAAEAAGDAHPARPEPLVLASEILLKTGRSGDAADRALGALRRGAAGADAYLALARALSDQGQHEDAVLALRQGEDRNPQDAAFWNEFGVLHLKLGNLDQAGPRFRRAAALAPALPSPWINLAILEQMRSGAKAALPHLRRAIECDPANGLAWSNFGIALRDAEMLSEAIGALRRAVELRPQHAQTRVNLATVLLDDGMLEEAERELHAAIAIEPGMVTAHVGLAQLHLRRGDPAAADAAYGTALQHHPDSPLARSGRGELQLWLRDFAHGWDNYESRLADGEMRRFPYPAWTGEPLREGALLVSSEQGIGDMILFASCYAELQPAGRVVLETPGRLVPLFTRSFPFATVVPYAGNELPQWLDSVPTIAASISAGSLMRLFRRSTHSFPDRAGYLRADPARTERWRAKLGSGDGRLKVGISWRGGFARTGRQARSVALAQWLPLLRVPGVDFVSLQYTRDAASEIAAFTQREGIPILHWQDAVDDYEETAALVEALDVVVTVCTAAAHLAGALGKETWILAPATPSWRYLGSGEDLPWYPTARVFRQAVGGGWAPAVSAAAAALAGKVGIPPQRTAAASTRAPVAEIAAAGEPARIAADDAGALGRAASLVREGRARDAIAALEALVDAEPTNGDAYAALARAYMAEGDREAAADCLTLALHHDPDNVGALWSLCEINDALGRVEAAIEPLERIVALGAAGVEARSSLARLYYRARRFEDAERAAAGVLAEHPDTPDALDVLGLARIGVEDFEGAIAPLERYLELHPGGRSAQQYLASAYIHRARFDEAARLLAWVLAREPNNYHAAWNLAYIDLAHRRFAAGWRNYERRRHLPERKQITANLPQWRGAPLEGRTLLVLGEQGLGDQIMFASCLPDVLRTGGKVVLTCDRRLVGLFERSFPGVRALDEATVRNDDVREAACETLAGTLPVLFRPDGHSFPAHRGYLVPDPARVAYWRERLNGLGPGPKFGLSWRGGTALTRTKLRSLDIEDVAQVVRAGGVSFVSLQYGSVDADLAALREHGIDLPHLPEVIPDYDETAALIAALDGVVSVCTALVHLTGALGRPAYVLVPSVPEWRYGVAGDDMPWYPSVRLFRQRGDEPWSAAIGRLVRELPRAA